MFSGLGFKCITENQTEKNMKVKMDGFSAKGYVGKTNVLSIEETLETKNCRCGFLGCC